MQSSNQPPQPPGSTAELRYPADADGPIATLIVDQDAPAGAVRELLLALQGEIDVDYAMEHLTDSPADRAYTIELPAEATDE